MNCKQDCNIKLIKLPVLMTLTLPFTTTVSPALLAVISKQYSATSSIKFIEEVTRSFPVLLVLLDVTVVLQSVPYDMFTEQYLTACNGSFKNEHLILLLLGMKVTPTNLLMPSIVERKKLMIYI